MFGSKDLVEPDLVHTRGLGFGSKDLVEPALVHTKGLGFESKDLEHTRGSLCLDLRI